MAATRSLLQHHESIKIVTEESSLAHRHRKSMTPYSPLNCLASRLSASTSTYSGISPFSQRTYSASLATSSASSSSLSHIITLRCPKASPSLINVASLSKVDQLIHNLSASPSAIDGLELARLLPNEAPVPTSTLVRPVKHLSYASSSNERYAGYKLVESICRNQESIRAIDATSLWEALRRSGLEVEAVARDAQLDALDAWVSRNHAAWGVCGVGNQLLDWLSVVIKSPSIRIESFNKLHRILQAIMERKVVWTESQLVKLLQLHCSAIERAIQQENSTSAPHSSSTPSTIPTDVDEAPNNLSSVYFPLEDAGFRLLDLLKCIHQHELMPESSVSTVMAALCQILEHIPEGEPKPTSALAAPVAQAIRLILMDEAYGQLGIEALEGFWAPVGDASNHRTALGALRVAKQIIIDCLSEVIGYNAPQKEPFKHRSETTPDVDRIMRALRKLPETWLVRDGGHAILIELVDLVELVMTKFRYGRRSVIASLVGGVILGLTGGLDLYWHKYGHTYKLSILEHNAAPTPVIAALERLLRAAQNDVVIQPPINTILLSRTEYLTDKFLHGLIVRLQQARQLEPSGAAWKWQKHVFTLLRHFSTAFEDYPLARRAFVEHLSEFYTKDAHAETFHTDLAGDVFTMLEKILPEETDEVVIKAGFDISLRELVLSYEIDTITKRIRTLWMKLALEDHPSSFRRVLSVKFFILGFNRFAFRPPQSLKIMEGKSDWKQSVSAANTAIYLYRDIVALAGLSRDKEGRVQGPLLQCPEARLVILQWLLRLRAGATHRIFAVDGPLTEVIPIATLANRVEGEKEESIQVPLETEFKQDPLVAARRKLRIWRRQSVDKQASNRSRQGSAASGPVTQVLSPVEAAPEPATPIIGPLLRPTLWKLPDRVRRDLFVGTSIPSPAMITFQTNKQTGYWLRVSIYVDTIADILEHDDCWEIVSYVLCHLPLQLANKHFFCGPKVNPTIRRLTNVICRAIKDNRLYKNVSSTGPMNVGQDEVQAMLYHTLTVLIAYRNRFRLKPNVLDTNARQTIDNIIESFSQGLRSSLVASRLCIEGLSQVVYAMPDEMAKFATVIVEGLARVMTNPDMAIHILEFLLVLGFSRKTYLGAFRTTDYQMVFAVALMYIEQHYRTDRPTLQTTDGKVSFSLAQHVLRLAFLVIHTWFMRIKPEERAQHIPFITGKLVASHKNKEVLSPMTISSLDSLTRYAYGNVDPKVTPSFMYKSIICPDVPDDWQSLRKPWRERHAYEMNNVADIQAFKLGVSIITVSIMKEPKGWIRMTSRRPSCHIDLVCHVEKDRSSLYRSEPLLVEKQDASSTQQEWDLDQPFVESLVHGLFDDIDKPDPISGLSWNFHEEGFSQSESHVINPALLAPLLITYPIDPSRSLQKFPDYNRLVDTLEMIDRTPVIDTHKVGIIYVGPGQSKESEILANRHGSPAYAHFIKHLGRVVKIRDELEVYTGGLQADKHGEYALAWWDDIGQILFHVATFMPNMNIPNMSSTYWKLAEIGNIHVKIVWNDSGVPYERETISGAFNHVNIVIEPHTLTPEAAYQAEFHTQGFFKVLLQVNPSLPRITPIGEFKLVAIDDLSRTVKNFALIACLFVTSWFDTGADSEFTMPINTNWQQRLDYINKSARLLPKEAEIDHSFFGLPLSEPVVK